MMVILFQEMDVIQLVQSKLDGLVLEEHLIHPQHAQNQVY